MPLAQLFSAGVRLLFFKAQHRSDDKTADLFAVEVPIKGHTTKHGTYVAPHTAIRHKKRPEPKSHEKPGREQAAVADLFDAKEDQPDKPSAEFTPTHELPDGTLVVAHPDEPGVWIDKDGTEYESDNAYPLKPTAPAEPAKPIETASTDADAAQYDLPEGARFKPGKGAFGSGKWAVELADGHATPLLPSKEQAADAAHQLVAMRQRAESERDAKAGRERAVADKVRAGEALTDQDLRDVGLRPGASQYSYLSLAIRSRRNPSGQRLWTCLVRRKHLHPNLPLRPPSPPPMNSPDGTKVMTHPDEPNVCMDANGTEYEGDNGYPLELPKRVAANESCDQAALLPAANNETRSMPIHG